MIEQNKIFKGSLNAVSIFCTLYPKLISGYSVPRNKISPRKKKSSIEKKKKKEANLMLQLVAISRVNGDTFFFSKLYIEDMLSFKGT